jgi:hypothetical protein
MKLYWLDGYASQFGDIFAVNMNHQSDKRCASSLSLLTLHSAYTDRYAQLRASESFRVRILTITQITSFSSPPLSSPPLPIPVPRLL